MRAQHEPGAALHASKLVDPRQRIDCRCLARLARLALGTRRRILLGRLRVVHRSACHSAPTALRAICRTDGVFLNPAACSASSLRAHARQSAGATDVNLSLIGASFASSAATRAGSAFGSGSNGTSAAGAWRHKALNVTTLGGVSGRFAKAKAIACGALSKPDSSWHQSDLTRFRSTSAQRRRNAWP